MIRFTVSAFAFASLVACTQTAAVDAPAYDPTFDATSTVTAIVAATEVQGALMPAAIQTVMADCIIKHATADELSTLAAARLNPTADTNALVSQILARESTTACAASKLTQS